MSDFLPSAHSGHRALSCHVPSVHPSLRLSVHPSCSHYHSTDHYISQILLIFGSAIGFSMSMDWYFEMLCMHWLASWSVLAEGFRPLNGNLYIPVWIKEHQNIVRHRVYSIISWHNPKQWLMIHICDLMVMRRWSTNALTFGKLKHTTSYIALKLIERMDVQYKFTLNLMCVTIIIYVQCLQTSLYDNNN